MDSTPLGLDDAPEEYLAWRIREHVRTSPRNRLHSIDDGPIFETPLVGFADGDDPLFREYKSIIGPFHLTPREAIQHALEEEPIARHNSIDVLSVVCWILPIAQETRISNRAQVHGPSRRWAHAKYYGEQFNDALRDHVVATLRGAGHLAIAPAHSSLFEIFREGVADPPCSTWSERHIQYVAGLGTFSLSDGFITPRGMAMRCGSVVTNLPLKPSPRRYERHYENCRTLMGETCAKCVERCPAGAISEDGHDKLRCQDYQSRELRDLFEAYQVGTSSCGLCQTDVPCEEMIPAKG